MNKIKNKIFAGIVFFVSLTAAFLYAGENYFVKEIDALSVDIVNNKKELNKFENRNNRLKETKENYDKIKYEIGNVSGVVVSKDNIVGFIEKMEKAAGESGVKLRIQAVTEIGEKPKEESYISQKKFSLTVGGDFDSIMQFIYNLENFEYYMNINNMSLAKGNFDDYNKDLTLMNASITVYQKQNEEN